MEKITDIESVERLVEAVIKDDHSTVQILLKEGVDPNGYIDRDQLTPLFFAAQNNAVKSAFLLMAAGADPNHYCISAEMTPLDVATLNNHSQMIRLLSPEVGSRELLV